MTPLEIEKKHESLIKRREKLNKEDNEFVSSIQETCHHPTKYLYKWDEHCDDGYGKWWKVNHISCHICGQEVHLKG
mgnify:CR=1 FL=1